MGEGHESHHRGSQDTFYVGPMKGERIYQQPFVDSLWEWASAKFYTSKTPITRQNLLNHRVLPFFTLPKVGCMTRRIGHNTEYRGKIETGEDQSNLA